MNVPVDVLLKHLGAVKTVFDDELHSLINDGLVDYKSAIAALKAEGLALDKRFYPWLRDVENLATGEFDKEPPAPAPAPAPELLSEKAEETVTAQPVTEPDNAEGAK